jgi:hypothetical protein
MLRTTTWEPPAEVAHADVVRTSDAVLARPDVPLDVREDVFRLRVLGLDWDVGGRVYEPTDSARIPVGADGKRAGLFVLHGGGGDFRSLEPLVGLLAGKLGFKVATMSYPGQHYLLDPSRDWPGDTLHPDGTARTPVWSTDSVMTPDQYELIAERSDPALRAKYGTMYLLRAKEGTEFYWRMAAWPLAFEEAMKAVCARNFPVDEYSIYVHGHSTGGPFVHQLLQRVENVAGLAGTETSPWGAIFSRMQGQTWGFPFNYLSVRTWRDLARYRGPEAGPEGCWRLPWLMEDVLEEWERRKHLANIKAQYLVQFAAFDQLEAAARVSAERLGLAAAATEALVARFRAYPCPLEGPGVKPIPPLLYGINQGSRDHTPERYLDVLFPALAALRPAPKHRLVRWGAGVHTYHKAEPGLPVGVAPAMAQLWHDAITQGYYVTD